jgi:anion-transporting  ArsA/GET3 family ATPase
MSGADRQDRRFDVDGLLDDPALRIVVCCGSGGVGKTTTAAALGLRAAERGRNVVVLTIDPARRLAQSLGVTELGNEPQRVPPTDATTASGGSLDAMMLDMKRTFDEVVEAHAEPQRAAAILANPFYQSLSSGFAGTQEYMAMEKLGQLRQRAEADGSWDLIVVDTPPSRSALDFLDAPRRLGRFLDGRTVRLLTAPARAGGRGFSRVLGAGISKVTGVFDRVLGTQLLADLQTFVSALDSTFGGFRERAEETYRVLRGEGTTFVVVAAPDDDALREAGYFIDRLTAEEMPLSGLVLNRVQQPAAPWLPTAVAAAARAEVDTRLAAGLLDLHADLADRAAHDVVMRELFEAAHPEVPWVTVPAMATDVHDVDGLRAIGAALADGTAAGGQI